MNVGKTKKMITSENRFIFLNSPEMGKEKIVAQESKEQINALPSGAEIVESIALAQEEGKYSAEELKEYFDFSEEELAPVTSVETLILMV
jgi:hypothetical protein